MPADVATAVPPANQKLRIATLRLTFVVMLPLIVFTHSGWSDIHWLYEISELLGTVLVFIGVFGRFWSILYIGGRKNRQVMDDGPYSMCRHPLYLFSTIAVVGFGLLLGSLVMTALIGGLTFLILRRTAIREERYLRSVFGAAYDDYAARVPRIIPNPRLFRTASDVTFSVQQLRGNMMDALVLLAFIPLAALMEVLRDYVALPTIAVF